MSKNLLYIFIVHCAIIMVKLTGSTNQTGDIENSVSWSILQKKDAIKILRYGTRENLQNYTFRSRKLYFLYYI